MTETKSKLPTDSFSPYFKWLRSIPNGQEPRILDNEIEGDEGVEKPVTISDDKVIDPVIAGTR